MLMLLVTLYHEGFCDYLFVVVWSPNLSNKYLMHCVFYICNLYCHILKLYQKLFTLGPISRMYFDIEDGLPRAYEPGGTS